METEQIDIVLVRASDDPKESSPEYQAELHAFSSALSAGGITYSQTTMTFGAIEAQSFPVGVFTIALAPEASAQAAIIVADWLRGRVTRKVRVKVGDVFVEGSTVEEIERILRAALGSKQSTKRLDRNGT
jgi:hypothetical protein